MLFPLKIDILLREIALFYMNFCYKFSSLWSKVEGHKKAYVDGIKPIGEFVGFFFGLDHLLLQLFSVLLLFVVLAIIVRSGSLTTDFVLDIWRYPNLL